MISTERTDFWLRVLIILTILNTFSFLSLERCLLFCIATCFTLNFHFPTSDKSIFYMSTTSSLTSVQKSELSKSLLLNFQIDLALSCCLDQEKWMKTAQWSVKGHTKIQHSETVCETFRYQPGI